MSTRTVSLPAGATRTRLWNADFLLLWQGQLVSQLGSQAAFVATMLWTLEATGSPGVMALLMLGSTLPGVVLAPVGGAVVDRHGRKPLLVAADLARGLAALAVGAALLLFPSRTTAVLALLFASALVSGLAGAVFGPAVRAAVPDLAPEHRLAAANSLTTMGGQVASLLGLALGGTLYVAVGAAVLFLADGASYLFSAASEGFIRLPRGTRGDAAPGLRTALRRYRSDTAEGVRYCFADPGRRGFMVLAGGLNFLFMPVFLLLPLFVETALGTGPEWYGFLLAGLSAGSLAGLLAAGTIGDRDRLRGPILALALLGTGVCMALLGLVTGPPAALLLMALTGALTGMVNVLVITLMQVRTPAELRGRALAVLIAVTGAGAPLGIIVGGGLGELTGGNVRGIFVLAGLSATVLAAALLGRRPVRRFLAASGAP